MYVCILGGTFFCKQGAHPLCPSLDCTELLVATAQPIEEIGHCSPELAKESASSRSVEILKDLGLAGRSWRTTHLGTKKEKRSKGITGPLGKPLLDTAGIDRAGRDRAGARNCINVEAGSKV
jgi:hypothetical protein